MASGGAWAFVPLRFLVAGGRTVLSVLLRFTTDFFFF
jgi:hypothetical protein